MSFASAQVKMANGIESKKTSLNLLTLTMIAIGQVIGAGVVAIIGTAIGETGNSAWIAYSAAVIAGFLTIIPYIFLSSTFVLNGGPYTIILSMLGDKLGGIYNVSFIFSCLSLGLLSSSMGLYLNSLFPFINPNVGAVVTLTFFFIANLMGVDVMAKLQKFLTYFLISALVGFGILGLFNVKPDFFSTASPEFAIKGLGGFLSAVVLLAYSTVGQSTVVNFGEDAENPKKNIPLAIIFASCIIMVVYSLVGIAAAGVLPIAQVANKPLTMVAKKLLPGSSYILFIILGPIFALATTLNSGFAYRTKNFLRGAEDGWFPKSIGTKNKKGAPIYILTAFYVVAIIPILTGLDIKTITNNLVLVNQLFTALIAFSAFRLPKICPEQWKQSKFHVPDGIYYVLISLAFIAQSYLIYLSIIGLKRSVFITSLIGLAACTAYALLRYKSGKVNIVSLKDVKNS